MVFNKKMKLDESAGSERQKPWTKRGRGSRTAGKLAPLFEMPLDIWLEIVSHLTPKELLALSRTSKHFRAMFMHRHGKHFWTAARCNVELPEPPQHISEPRVAALLFSSTCFECGNLALLYDIGLTVRYCKRCKTGKVKDGRVLRKTYGISQDTSMLVLQLLPCSRGRRRRHYYSDVHKENDERDDLYEVEEFDSVFYQYSTLLGSGNQDALQAFFNERRQLVQAARQFSKELKEWEGRQYAAQQDARIIRQASIEKRLLELGYTKRDLEDFASRASLHSLRSWDGMVSQPQKLTPRVWTRIRPRLEGLLNTERERRKRQKRYDARLRELRSVYAEFLRDVPLDFGTLPDLDTAEQLPAVRALLDEDDARVPVTIERLYLVLPALKEAPPSWQQPTADLERALNNALTTFFRSLPGEQKAMLNELPSDEREETLTRLFEDHLASVRRRWGPQSQQQNEQQNYHQEQQIEHPTLMCDTGAYPP